MLLGRNLPLAVDPGTMSALATRQLGLRATQMSECAMSPNDMKNLIVEEEVSYVEHRLAYFPISPLRCHGCRAPTPA